MEASALQAGPGLGRPRISLGTPLLRLRSDQQLLVLFREGNEEAFRVIHDRYRTRLLAYMRQMLPGRSADVEDALQDVFVRTYAVLRTGNRAVALRPWLYRVAHNRCIDELRRPLSAPGLLQAHDPASDWDPAAETEKRESFRGLMVDIGRLPEQQRSALLMREMSGMAYADVASALGTSVPAVKSLLARARIGLAQALEARDAACVDIRRELAEAHEEGVRPSWMARRHLRDCACCRACRAEMRVQGRRVAALAPTAGPLALFAKLFGIGTGGGGGTATAASAGGATAAGTGGTLTAASGLATLTMGHVATIVAAAVVTAGGAVAVQQTVVTHGSRHPKSAVQATSAASAGAATRATMGVPALIPPPPHATHANTSPVTHTLPAPSPSDAGAERWRGPVAHLPRPVASYDSAAGQSTPADTTCTPPPTACTASQTTSCSTGSGSTTSSGTQAATPQTTTTGTTTTTTGSDTTTIGTTSGATSGTASGTTAPTCATTAQSTGAPGTGSIGSGQTGTAQTGTAQTGSGQPAKQA